MSAAEFRKRFLALIAFAWSLPAVVGLSVIVYTEIFSVDQIVEIMTTPLEPAFIIGSLVFALWYFDRAAKPVVATLKGSALVKTEVIDQFLASFPLRFWLAFVAYLLLAVVVTIKSAELHSDFSAKPVDWFRINLVAMIVSIIVGLPIFFSIFDLFGRAFGSIHFERPVVTIKTRVFMIGALVPLLIDTMLVQYFWSRTGYFTWETIFIWFFLELLAIAGALLFVRSFAQSLSPFESVLGTAREPGEPASPQLIPASTDELGKLSQDMDRLLNEQLVHRERLTLSNQLLKALQTHGDMSRMLAAIINRTQARTDCDICLLGFFDEHDEQLSVVIYSGADYLADGHFQIPLDQNSLFSQIRSTGQMCVIDDAKARQRQIGELVDHFAIRSIAAAPLTTDKNNIGILACVHKSSGHGFSQLELDILSAFAHEAALVETLNRDLIEKRRAEHAISLIMDGISTAIGEQFFPAIARAMAEILGADVVSIGVLSKDSSRHIESLSFIVDGEPYPNLKYALAGTPCATVLGNEPKSYTSGIQQLFPDDLELHQLGMEAYIGVPLFDSHDRPLGVQFAMFRRPVDNPGFTESVLGIFAARTAAEIERARTEERIKHMAYHDSLTQLPNRELLIDRLNQSLAHANRMKNYLAVVMLDLDHFKTINDTLGHPVGDDLLIRVGQRLHRCIRGEDTVARIGGDEFVILLTDLGSQDTAVKHATQIAEKITNELRPPFSIHHNRLAITSSLGIALYPDDGISPEILIKHADDAMYQAKEHGRNNYQFFSTRMNAVAVERHQMLSDIRQALEHEQFYLVYQPKISIHDEKVIGAEALVRWAHPEKGQIMPIDFIQVAEETGLIIPLGNWVMQEACSLAASLWNHQDHCNGTGRLSVNVSPLQFKQADFVDVLGQTIAACGARPQCIEIELTENVLIDSLDLVQQKMMDLKQLGVRISIDDFGTGYSSLRYLQQLPIDTVKVDLSFVKNIVHDDSDAAIVETINTMARHMNVQTIAEGVETSEQLALLTQYGCQGYQGFLFSEPLTTDAFIAAMQQTGTRQSSLGSQGFDRIQ